MASPLVRFQLENVYRPSYILTAPDGPDAVLKVMGGTELRRLKAHDTGAPLTDRELVERARSHSPWLPGVYEASNAWVHFSERHIFTANRVTDGGDGAASLIGRMPVPAEWIPVGFLAELPGAMREATLNLFGLFEVYEEWKFEHPSAEPSGLDLNDTAPPEADS